MFTGLISQQASIQTDSVFLTQTSLTFILRLQCLGTEKNLSIHHANKYI